MFSAFADALFERLIVAFPADPPQTPATFSQAPMPPSVAFFLTRLLQRRLEYELSTLEYPSSVWIDHHHAEVKQMHENLYTVLLRHGHFPEKEWEDHLYRVVHEVVAYLVQPVTTVVSFVFQEEARAIPIEMAERRMQYFLDYRWLREGFQHYVQQNGLTQVDPDALADLLRDIVLEETRIYDAPAWQALLTPLFDLIQQADPDVYDGLPVDMLQSFFEDTGLGVLHFKLNRLVEEEGLAFMRPEEVTRLFAPIHTIKVPIVEEVGEPEEEEEEEEELPTYPSRLPEASREEAVPLWKRFQQQTSRAVAPSRNVPQQAPPPAAQPSSSVPRWMQFRKQTEAAPAPSRDPEDELTRLEALVLGEDGTKNRKLFIRSLFDNTTEDYVAVLYQLEAAHSWGEASRLIATEVFQKYQVNIYSTAAVLFTDLVEARFSNHQ